MALLLSGCHCRPSLPGDSSDTEDEPPPEDQETADTSPPLPCPVPEAEPNDAFNDANVLPLEQWACGAFDDPGDFDVWSFDLPVVSWLGVTVKAESLGSYANAVLVLTAEDGSAADIRIGHETKDPRLLFPASAGGYLALLSESNIQGATDLYFYELLATQAKAPLGWSVEELEDNGTYTSAQFVSHEDVLMAGFESSSDNDWFAIAVPSGKHTLRVDVDAFEYGSAADLGLFLYSSDLEPLPEGCAQTTGCGFYHGEQGWELDPVLEYSSTGDEEIYIRVDEAFDRGGDPYWYILNISLEGT